MGTFLVALLNLSSTSPLRFQTISVFIAGLISLGITVVGIKQVQGNYLALSAPYWILLSAVGAHQLLKFLSARYEIQILRVLPPRIIAVLGACFLAYLPLYYYESTSQNPNTTRFGVRMAGEEIRLEVADGKCIVLSSYPQSAWYSKCLLGLWAGTTEENITQGAKGSNFNNIVRRTLLSSDSARWQAMRNYQNLDEYRKFVVLVTKGKRQPSDLAIESDQYTLLERIRTTNRVFYAEIDGLTIKGP
jgi:hypothetical protein